MCAYDELYLPLAQRALGDMYDYSVNSLKFNIDDYHHLFIVSGIAEQVEMGNPMYIAGKNGCEIAREVVEICTGLYPDKEDIMYLDKSPEYWTGWSLAYYQWESGHSFKNIDTAFPIGDMVRLYPTLHEADVSLFTAAADERYACGFSESALRRFRIYAGLTQKELAARADVPLRQVQLFEQGQRDIKKTQGQTLIQLARTLHCQVDQLIN